jgi:hypothetical protein
VSALQSYAEDFIAVFVGAWCAERLRTARASDIKAIEQLVDDDVLPIFVEDSDDRSVPTHAPSPEPFGTSSYLSVVLINTPEPAEKLTRQSISEATDLSVLDRERVLCGQSALLKLTGTSAVRGRHSAAKL